MTALHRLTPVALALATTAAVVAAGCNKTKALPARDALPATRPATVLGPGDELELRFYYAPELNTTQRVRADGRVSLQLVGDVSVRGLSPSELTTRIEGLYADQLKYPELSLIVRNSYSQRVLIGGEVARTGSLEMPAQLSVLEAIMLAGGFNLRTANVKQVIVMRKDPTDETKRTGYAVDLAGAIAGAPTEAFMLAAGDIVFVPRTTIVNVNQFVSQYISGVIPDVGVVYNRPLGDGNITLDPRSNVIAN